MSDAIANFNFLKKLFYFLFYEKWGFDSLTTKNKIDSEWSRGLGRMNDLC